MKVLVCGGRDFKDYKFLSSILSQYRITHIVNGGALGADYLSSLYAVEFHIPFTIHHADWDKYGRKAGPIRNQKMLDTHPDIELVIAFPRANGIIGTGTQDMINKAGLKGIEIIDASDLYVSAPQSNME